MICGKKSLFWQFIGALHSIFNDRDYTVNTKYNIGYFASYMKLKQLILYSQSQEEPQTHPARIS